MAFDNDLLERMNVGNKQALFYSCTADAATGSVVTGFESVDAVAMTPKSMASTVGLTRMNEGVAGTSIAGTVSVTGVTSGDTFYLLVYGH